MKFTKGAQNPKASEKAVAVTGTHVPEKDFSTKAKTKAADGSGKPEKGSLATGSKLPTEGASSSPVPEKVTEPKKVWEGSTEDWSKDYKEAKRKGISTEQWEDSAGDRISDAAGEKKFRDDDSDKVQHAPEYKKGVSAFANSPKTSHGFGHPASARDGHLRNSGHSSAHRLGKKK
jgi:hypothetical protein